jgi:hypothetical protein
MMAKSNHFEPGWNSALKLPDILLVGWGKSCIRAQSWIVQLLGARLLVELCIKVARHHPWRGGANTASEHNQDGG